MLKKSLVFGTKDRKIPIVRADQGERGVAHRIPCEQGDPTPDLFQQFRRAPRSIADKSRVVRRICFGPANDYRRVYSAGVHCGTD